MMTNHRQIYLAGAFLFCEARISLIFHGQDPSWILVWNWTLEKHRLLQYIKMCLHSTSWGYASRYRKAAAEIQHAFPGTEVVGNPKGSSRTGSFEVTDDKGKVYWSKLGGQGFPNDGQVVEALKKGGFQ